MRRILGASSDASESCRSRTNVILQNGDFLAKIGVEDRERNSERYIQLTPTYPTTHAPIHTYVESTHPNTHTHTHNPSVNTTL